MKPVLKRLFAVLLVIAIWLDEGAQVVIRGAWFIATGKGDPSPHETISAWLGMSQAAGKPVGSFLARRVDSVLGAGHCARAMNHEKSVDSPL